MRKRILSLIMAVCMLFSMIPVVSAAESPVTVTILGKENETAAAEVFDLVNQMRADHGRTPLTRNATLSELAMHRAAEIALYYSHTRPDGTNCSSILDGAYTGWYNFGENIAINQPGPEAAMESWMNSQGHRDNILSADFTQVGVGCFYSDGVYCWVQLFGNSTSNTAETTRTGETDVMVDVQILPSNLSVETLAVMDLEMSPGQTHTILIEAVNPEFVYSSPALIVEPGYATDEHGIIIATSEVDPLDGAIVITAVNPGTAVMEIPVYEGQPDPVTFQVTVPDDGSNEDPFQPQPTEPAPTEPQPTEPEPTVPAPTEPQPTEPDPTEPQPSEPEGNIIDSGDFNNNVNWVLYEDGTMIISGEGVIRNIPTDNWKNAKAQVIHLIIEDGITEIGADAFKECTSLVSAEIPDSVTLIRSCAFMDCTALASVTLPDNITEIPLACFRGCTSLVAIEIPDGVNYIYEDAFAGCTSLQAVVIPDSVIGMERISFSDCPNLVIYCYGLSYAYYYAVRCEYAFELMEDEPGTPTYNISAACNDGGQVIINPTTSPANRYAHIAFYPEEGYTLDQVYYLCVSDPELELTFVQESDFSYRFLMPEGDVVFEVYFLATESPFKDVKKTDYFFDPVLWAVSYGITTGMGNGSFAPSSSCTRAQVVTFLWRAAGEPEPVSTINPFTDVKETDYFYKAVLWAVENGITTGMSATSFGPSRPCTRGQVVTFLYRAAGEPDPYFGLNPFTDAKPTDYYYEAVLWAVENGITAGMTNTTFAPSSTCTRGQVVTFLYRFLR